MAESMDVFYSSLRDENNYSYGHDNEHLEILSDLYTDDSHFIYEILQNAEDAQASEVKFVLYKDRLEILHNGKRAFNEQDVKSITKIAKSTKKTDVNTVGKFGLGFKSVYSVTDEPEIHSGDYDFKITEFIRPYPVAHKDVPASYTTLFVLPFKPEKKEQVYDKLGHKFQDLELKTVLFLSNIKSICWEIAEDDQNFYKKSGTYLKEDGVDKKTGFKRVTCLSDTSTVPDQWFVFSRGSKDDTFIEIAFKYDEEKKQIVPANNTDLVVLFPTEKETGLNFIINGNFQTTPARDNVPPEKEHNKKLIVCVQELLKSIIPELKDKGLMDVSLMKTLPTDKRQFESDKMAFFRPIYDTVKELFKTQDLIPTTEKAVYAKAGDLAAATSSDLTEIYTPYHKKWLITTITRNNDNSDLFNYLTKELNVPVISPLQFCQDYLSKDYLSNKDDKWFKRFYAFLADDKEALWRESSNPKNVGVVRSKPIIRLENDELVTPDEGAFLPTGTSNSGYQTVKQCFVDDKESYDFLLKLGLKKPNQVDALEKNTLKKYSNNMEISDEEYLADIKLIVSVLQSADVTDNEKQRIKEYPIVKCEDGMFRKSHAVYQNTEELHAWFGGQKRDYAALCLETEDLSVLGVVDFPHVNSVTLHNDKIPQNIKEKDRTKTQDDVFVDIELDGLEDINVTTDNAIHVANIIQKMYKKVGSVRLQGWDTPITLFNGVYGWMRNRFYEKSAQTRVLTKLHSINWVLTKENTLANPMNISMDQLHPSVLFLSNLPDCVFGADLKQQLCDQLAQMGACPVLCDNQEEVEVAKRAIEELRAKKNQQQPEDVISNDDEEPEEPQEEDWEPDVAVNDVEIEDGYLRYVSPDRGEVGSVSNTKGTEATCKTDDPDKAQKQTNYSEKDKQKIGEYGEKVVKRYLVEEEGFDESEIEILNTNWENSTGRDIEITKDGELVRYIEVKSTTETTPCKHLFETSGKQWEVARKHQDKYWLYCVFGVGTDQVTVVRIQNPNKMWKDGKLEAHPVNFVVKA